MPTDQSPPWCNACLGDGDGGSKFQGCDDPATCGSPGSIAWRRKQRQAGDALLATRLTPPTPFDQQLRDELMKATEREPAESLDIEGPSHPGRQFQEQSGLGEGRAEGDGQV